MGLSMPVSSINSAFLPGQASLTGAMAQRAYRQEQLPIARTVNEATAIPATDEQAAAPTSTSVGATGPIGSQTGVAAYIAIMNPSASTSMRIEA
jgi:hypothetical protein